jgi:hypothetical protein
VNPAFRGLLAGQVVSIAGDRFNYLALVALLSAHAARLGHGPEGALALLAWAMLAPALVLSPWAGAIVDRLPLVRGWCGPTSRARSWSRRSRSPTARPARAPWCMR